MFITVLLGDHETGKIQIANIDLMGSYTDIKIKGGSLYRLMEKKLLFINL